MNEEQLKQAMRLIGQRGGQNNVKKYGKDHMSNIGKMAAAKRWAGHVKKVMDGTPAKQ